MVAVVRCKEHYDQKHQYINLCEQNEFGEVCPLCISDSRLDPLRLTLSCRPRCKSSVGTTNKSKSRNRTPSSAKPNGSTRSSSEVTPHLPSTVTPKHTSLLCLPPPTRLSLPLLDARNARPLIHLSCILSDRGSCAIVVGSIRSFQRTGSPLSLCCDIPSFYHFFLFPCVVVLLSLLLGSGSLAPSDYIHTDMA